MSSRVLVIEDRDSLRHMLIAVLQDAGYRASGVASAAAALERLPDVRPELIILDMEMPGTNGHEFLRRLRENPQWGDVPVLIVSGHGETCLPTHERRGIAVLAKPFDTGTLLECVASMVRRSIALHPSA